MFVSKHTREDSVWDVIAWRSHVWQPLHGLQRNFLVVELKLLYIDLTQENQLCQIFMPCYVLKLSNPSYLETCILGIVSATEVWVGASVPKYWAAHCSSWKSECSMLVEYCTSAERELSAPSTKHRKTNWTQKRIKACVFHWDVIQAQNLKHNDGEIRQTWRSRKSNEEWNYWQLVEHKVMIALCVENS